MATGATQSPVNDAEQAHGLQWVGRSNSALTQMLVQLVFVSHSHKQGQSLSLSLKLSSAPLWPQRLDLNAELALGSKPGLGQYDKRSQQGGKQKLTNMSVPVVQRPLGHQCPVYQGMRAHTD